MKEFKIEETTVVFWKDAGAVFCKVDEMGADVYCCSGHELPSTEAEAMKMAETAWMW